MKKTIIGALVGGVLIFIWQFLSWMVLDLHRPAQQYTPKQTEIISYLNSQFTEDGSYMVPTLPAGSSNADMEKYMKESVGKPWAQISYHKSNDVNMGATMAMNLLANIAMVWLFCWIISGFTLNSFAKTYLAALFTGMIIFLHSAYAEHIWFQTPDLFAFALDFLISWSLVGLWLGWLWNRKKRTVSY